MKATGMSVLLAGVLSVAAISGGCGGGGGDDPVSGMFAIATLLFGTGDDSVTGELSPDGNSAALGSDDSSTVQYGTVDGDVSWTASLGGVETEGIAMSGDGSTIVVGGQGGGITTFSAAGAVKWSSAVPQGEVNVAVNESGNRVYAVQASLLGDVLYSYNSVGDLLWSAEVPAGDWGLWGVSCSADGLSIIVRSNSDTFQYDGDGLLVSTNNIVDGNNLFSAVIAEDGRTYVVAYNDPVSGTCYLARYGTDDEAVRWVQAVPNSLWVVCDMDENGRVYSTSTAGPTIVWEAAGTQLYSDPAGGFQASVSRDGTRLLLGGHGQATVFSIH